MSSYLRTTILIITLIKCIHVDGKSHTHSHVAHIHLIKVIKNAAYIYTNPTSIYIHVKEACDSNSIFKIFTIANKLLNPSTLVGALVNLCPKASDIL